MGSSLFCRLYVNRLDTWEVCLEMNPKYLCYNKKRLLLERCSTCSGATTSCGLYESDENPFQSQQPEDIACQGEGEMFKTLSARNESGSSVASSIRNPSADTYLDNLTMIGKVQKKLMLERRVK